MHSTNSYDNFGGNWPVSEASLTNFLSMSTEFAFMGERRRKSRTSRFPIQLLILVYEECFKYRRNLFHYTKKAQWFRPFSELPQHGLPLEQSFVNNKLLSNDMFVGNLTIIKQHYISDWYARGRGYDLLLATLLTHHSPPAASQTPPSLQLGLCHPECYNQSTAVQIVNITH